MKITKFGDGIPVALDGWSTGYQSIGSNTDSNPPLSALNFVQRITANTSNTLLNPIVNFASGSGVSLSASSNTLTISASGGGGGSPLTVEDEGTPLTTDATTLNFTGAGVTASGAGATKTINIPGGTADFSALGWYNVEDYGAVHDGTTDDTVAIQAAIDACLAGGGGTVWFPCPKGDIYQIDGALQDTGTFNAQLEIGHNAGDLIPIRFLGGDGTLGGAYLRSSWNGTISGTPAVISAGTHDTHTWNNVYVAFEGVVFLLHANPKLTAIDMTAAVTVRFKKLSITPTSLSSPCTNANAIGLDMPWAVNSQNSGGEDLYINGMYIGIRPDEQMVADAIYTSYCVYAAEFRGATASPDLLWHACSVQRWNVWYCNNGFLFSGDVRTVYIDLADFEHDPAPWTATYDITDPSNYGRGVIGWNTCAYGGTVPTDDLRVNGAAGLSLVGGFAKRWRIANVLDIPVGTNPSTNPTSGRRFYTDSSTGHFSALDSSGTVIDYEAASGAAGGDLSGTYPNPSVVDDSHSHTAATISGVTGSGDHTHIVDEQFSGDASTTVFYLANSAVPDSVMAYVSGARTPVTLGGSLLDEITFAVAPASATLNVSVDYAAVSS